MARKALNPIQQLAKFCGIQPSYVDTQGKEQVASTETLLTLLKAFDLEPGSEGEAMMLLKELRQQQGQESLPEVHVCWAGERNQLEIFVPEELRGTKLKIELEDGGEVGISPRGMEIIKKGREGAKVRMRIPELPLGYHRLRMEGLPEGGDCLLLSALKRVYELRAKTRHTGVFAPLYAVHTERSWGAGNFSDWAEFARWVSGSGAGVVGTLPILAAFLDPKKCEPSPYSPASRLFWNEFFIDIPALPELESSRAAKRLVAELGGKIREFQKGETIDYGEQMQVRRKVLEKLAAEFFTSGRNKRGEFREFVKENRYLMEYALFRALTEERGNSWQSWPEKRLPKGKKSGALEQRTNYHLYVQFAAARQLKSVLDTCREKNVLFYLDLPVGVNPDGFDAWRFRDVFAAGINAGAPPDAFFTKGQDWGFAPLHPGRLRRSRYEYFIEFLRFQMKHTGMLRIDHVMGLHRLFWVPHGRPASEGAYVHYRSEEMYAILSIESHRYKTVLIGENLGTVPPEVNKGMDRHGIRKMYVLQYENPQRGELREPGRLEIGSLNTHDMPTFAAYCEGKDIEDRQQLGLLTKSQAAAEKKVRKAQVQNLERVLRKEKLLGGRRPRTGELMEGCLRYLARSEAETVLLNVEDLWLERRPQNVPGTSTERPNWRRKLGMSMEELEADEQVRSKVEAVVSSRRSSGKAR